MLYYCEERPSNPEATASRLPNAQAPKRRESARLGLKVRKKHTRMPGSGALSSAYSRAIGFEASKRFRMQNLRGACVILKPALMYRSISEHTSINTSADISIRPHIHKYVHAYMHSYIHTYIHTYADIQTHRHTDVHPSIHPSIHPSVHACKHGIHDIHA